jgi:hypothetical protein
MTEGTKKPKTPDPYAAIRRAVETAKELTTEDRAIVVKRLETGKPKMGLVGMAKIEEAADKLTPDHRALLISDIKKIPAAAPATVAPASDNQTNK